MSTPLDKVFSIDNILSQKLSVIDAVTEKKQAAINPDVAALKQYWAEYDADATRRMAESPRLPHELTEDAANAMARTTTNLVGGTLALGLSLDAVNPASEIGEAIGLPQEGRELVQKARGAVVNKTADIDKILARRMSKTSQINEALVAQANAADQQRNAVAYEGAVADGAIPLVAGAAELGKNIVAGGENLVDNPVALGNAVIGQLPTLGVGLGANLAVRAEGVAARAALLAEARGMGMDEATKLARTQLATRNLMAGVGGTEAGGAFQGAAEGILDPNVSLDQLAQVYPEIQERMAAGEDEISIRGDLASKAGLTAAAIQGPLAAITSRIAANFELNPVGLGGNATKGLVAKTTAGAADVGKEAIEETIQSGTGQLATNLGQIAAGNVEVDALDEVGVAAGAGGVAGAGMAAGFKAPGLVATATAAGAKAVYETGKRTISKRFADIEARVEAEVGPQRAAVAARTEANLQRAEARMAAANITAPASVSVADEPILSPETKADLGANEEDVTGTAGLGRAMKLLGSKELPAERREELSLYAYKQALNLGAVAEQARGQLESMPEDDPLRPSMQAVYDTVLESLQDPGFQEVVSFLQNQEPEAIQAKLDAVPVDYDPTTADATTTQAFESVKTLAYAAPDKFTPEGARKTGALFQSLGNDADKVQGKLIIDVADIKATYEEQAAQIQANYPEAKVKSSNMVTREIADKGFSFTKRDGSTVKLSSVADYVSSVSQAMASGQVQIAAKRMAGLMNFAKHMSNKAQAFDSGAIELIDAGLQNDPKARKSLDYSTLDASGKPTKAATAFVSLATDGGMALVDSVFADAEAVTGAFNSLVQAYPAAAKILKAASLPGPGQVKWKSHTAPEAELVPEAPQETVAAVSTPAASTEPAQVKPAQEAVQELVAEARVLNGDVEPVVDFGTEERAAPEELAAALAMTPESYLAAVNPEGKTTPAATDEAIQEELDDMEAPADAPVIGQVDGLELKANGDFLYAVDGDRVIGLLVHKEDGTTLMVNKDYRGRGVGKALMKELLVRKPMAKTNGMSELAKATRLSVLRDLRGDKKKPTTIQERFAGLIQSIGEGLGSVNQFIAGFRLKKSSRSAMNRMENPTEEMLAMINQAIEAKDPEMVKSLFVEDQRLLKVGADQVQALRTLFADAVPMIVQQLNANLQAASRGEQTSLKGVKSKAKGFLARFVADGAKEWSYQNRKTLHVTKVTEDRKNLEYQPEVVEGMALAAVHWAIANINNPVNYDETKIEAMFPEGVSDEIREAFRKYHFFEQPNRNLAREIQQMLAVSANPAAPLNYSDGLSKQLASDTLRALHDLGIITIRTEDLENKKTLNFIEFNKDTQPKWDGTGLLSLQGVRDQLDKPSLLTRLLLPDSRDVASIGKPPAKSSSVVRGTNTPLSAQQRQNIEVLENIPFKLNMPFLEFTSKLGPRFMELVGFTPGELADVNVRDLVSVDGINRGIDAAMGNLADMYEQMLNYAEENGMAVEDVPVHFGWEVISNGRMMMTAAGPQSNKILREIFSANHSTVDLKNVDQMKELGLAIAQAMGIKTEQKSNIEAINELQDMFAKPGYAELFESLRALDAQEDADPALADQVFEQLQDLGISSERAIHAVHVWSRFEVADESVPFKHALAFELDGKTDGPINALVHFGLWNFTEKQLVQLKQGGFIIDDPMKPTLNAQGKQLGDLYGTSAKNLQDQIPKLLADAQRMPGRLKILNASKDLLLFLGHAGMTESESGSTLEIKRSVAKHGVMATNYGSGLRSIVSVIAFEFTDKLYAEITKTIRDGGLLDPNLIELTETMVGHALPDLHDPNTYQSFQLRRGDTTTILENLLGTKKAPGVGRALVAGITSEMAPIVETFKVLYKSTAAQVFSMRRSFTAAYKAKHAELVAAGKIMPQDALSREQEQEIIKQFADQMPIFKLMLASGAGEGLNVSQRDFAGELQLDGRRTEKVEAITGGLSMDINATSFPDPGVRAAALFTIALGDATMMSQMFLKAGNMLNVYDGLEVTVGEIAQRALEVNKAVWQGWQYDALSAAADSFEQIRINVKELTEAEVIELADGLRLKHEGVPNADVRVVVEAELSNTQWHLRTLAIKNQAAKKAIAKRHVSVDHMSGGERPYVIENDAEGDTVASIQRDMAIFEEELRAQYIKGLPSTTAQVDKNLSDRLGLTGSDAVRDIAELDKFELEWMLSDYVFPNKLHRFIFDQIKHLLPDNLRVFIGSPAAIARAKAEQFDGVDLGGPREVGAYYKDTIFLSVASPETLVHELVHATSLHLIESFYLNNGKGLTTAQKDAVRSLELLSKRFVEIETDKMPAETAEAVERAQAVVYAYQREGNMPFAVNEFMAWTLTNPQIARAMQKTSRLETLKMLAKSVLATVRKLLGLPNNQAIETFFEQSLGHFHRLVRRESAAPSSMSPMALFQSLGGPATAHETHLQETMVNLERVISGVPDHLRTVEQHERALDALTQAANIREQFLDAGFRFTDKEATVFGLVHAVFASAAALDPVTMTSFQEIQRQVMPSLEPEDFLENRDSATEGEMQEARRKFNALFQIYTEDKSGRSNLLANFVGLAMVHEPLRKKLSTMTMPRQTLKRETLDETLRNGVRVAFDKLSDTVLRIGGDAAQTRNLDTLVLRLAETQEQLGARLAAKESPLEKVDAQIKNYQQRAAGLLQPYIDRRIAGDRKFGKIDGYINLALVAAKGLLTAEGADAFQRGGETFINSLEAPKFVRELLGELLGMSDSNAAVGQLLTRTKHAIARVRQRLREEGPGIVRDLFEKKYDHKTWESMYRSVASTDLQSLMSTYSLEGVTQMVQDDVSLDQEIASAEAELEAKHRNLWTQGAEHLAQWMVNRENNAVLLRRNAHALSKLAGSPVQVSVSSAQAAEPILDRLVSLHAIKLLKRADRDMLADMLTQEAKGMQGMMRLMRSLAESERGKPGADLQALNAWKGYAPIAMDPRTDLVLAGADKGAQLLKRGYRLVAPYVGDSVDTSAGMAYYATSLNPGKFELISGGKPTFNQGAMQTVQATVMGVDKLTGQTLDASANSMITAEETVDFITARKMRMTKSQSNVNLIPVFDFEGKIVAYERVMDHAFLEQHLRVNKDLANSIGAWMGRQAEESLARSFNGELVQILKNNWDEGVSDGREKEYVDLLSEKDPTVRDAWNAIPRETQEQMIDLFDGRVMIRKDMINNALGYRSASVADVFTGVSNLPEPVRAGLEKAALGMFGLNAYRYLYTAERTWQGLVGQAKDWIVVRSGVVMLANGFANQFQLLQMGVPWKTLIPTQIRKIKETEQFLRNERRIAQLRVAISAATQVGKKRELEQEARLLQDENMRLSIYPLIQAGELPSITEGLSEQDEYSLLHDIVGWVEKKMEKLPKGLSTTARYAVIAKDTALYQGLNRGIQFGDFMAKAALYDHLLSTGLTKDEALLKISESFVNYNLMAGRSRDYLESMGLTWFLNYKLRIQKIVLRNIRENPLRFLMAGMGAEVLGADSLISSSAPNANWNYGFGPGPFFAAHNALMWDQLM